MKVKFFAIFFMVSFLASTCWAGRFEFMNIDKNAVLKKSVVEYNKHLDISLLDRLSYGKSELKNYKKYLKENNIKKFLKADLIGDTVYFKNGKQTIRFKILAFEDFNKTRVEIQGHEVLLDRSLGFEKNLNAISKVISQKNISWLEAIFGLPQAHAEDDFDLVRKFKKEINTVSSFTWLASSILRERITNVCSAKRAPIPEDDFRIRDEIQELAIFQEKYVTPVVKSNQNCDGSHGGDVMFIDDDPCPVAPLERCINELAEARFKVLNEEHSEGFNCWKISVNSSRWYLLNSALTKDDFKLDTYNEDMDTQCKEPSDGNANTDSSTAQ